MSPPLPLINQDRLETWLLKVGYPAKPVKWAITPATGRVLMDAWKVYEGDITTLPLDTRMTWCPVDGKQTYHIILHENTSGSAMVPPEIVQAKRELQEFEERLNKKHADLKSWEDDLRAQDIDIRKTLALQTRTGKELDERVGMSMARLKEWDGHIVEMQKKHLEDTAYIDEILEEKHTLAEKNAIAASVVLVCNKLASAYMLKHVKKFEDLKPEDIADYQKYLVDRAERQFFADMPSPANGIGESFTRMPDSNKRDFARGIIMWSISYDPSIIMECYNEHQESMKNTEQNDGEQDESV